MKYFFTYILLLCFITLQAQQSDLVDFKTISADIEIIPENKIVKGQVKISFEILHHTDSIFIDAQNAKVKIAKQSPINPKIKVTANKIWLYKDFKQGQAYQMYLDYQITNPQKTLYFVGWDNKGRNQIWSQGQGHHTSYWLPSIDDKNDKIVFEVTYHVPKTYTAVGNGKLISHKTIKNQEVWHYKMQHPMSSYLVAVAVGKYKYKSITSANGTEIKLYYEPEFANQLEPTYRYSKEIFDFLEQEIGVDYPWVNYKQIPVRDFLYAGMENTTATIFAESFFTDSIGFIDKNYVNVNAHELAHQWFGNMVSEKSSKSHWLQEGFASYYALLTEKKIFGEDDYYYQLYKTAEQLKAESDKGKGEALNDPKANSLTFYQKGAWALHILREKLGDKAFKSGVKSYLEKYKFQNVTIDDFIKEMEKSSGQDLSMFVEDWIEQSAFQAKAALRSLRKSPFIANYLDIATLRGQSLDEKYTLLDKALNFPVNKYIGQEVVLQLAKAPQSDQRDKLLKKAFETNNILVRQAIAESIDQIPEALKSDYEKLLNDHSYATQETALFNLWNSYPENRTKYLDKLKNTQGFYDKNVRMMWLTLTLVTQNYKPEKNNQFYQELSGYTSPRYDYSIRRNAFGHLYQINSFSQQNYKDLMEATTHKVWRFRNFARELLDALLKENVHKQDLQVILPLLPDNQKKILKNAIKKSN